MSWIKSYQELERHPKIASLMLEMGWDLDTTIGKLHRFWWWCLDYAADGNLSRFNPQQVGRSCDADGVKLMESMIKAGFIDKEPYIRLHDWWEYAGEFLRGRYASKPEVWKAIKDSYSRVTPELLQSNYGKTSPQKRVEESRVEESRVERVEKKSGAVARFSPPTIEEVSAYCQERGGLVDAQRWFAYYQSNGWRVGRNPMKDWKAAVRTWERNGYSAPGREQGNAAAPVKGKYDGLGDKV